MEAPARRPEQLAIVGSSTEIISLLEAILQDEGYQPRVYPLEASTVAAIAETKPSLIVLEVGMRSAALPLLDAIRVDPATRVVPVIALGTLEPIREQAQASGNVYAVLPAPFELGDLLDAIGAALRQTPFEARTEARPPRSEAALLQAADILSRSLRQLMLGWAQKIRSLEPFASRPDLSTRDFLNSVPRILNALVLVLRHQTPSDVLVRDPDALHRISEHAATCHSQGLPAEAVVREYQVLREVLAGRLERELPAEDVVLVMDELNVLLDEAVRITVAEYVRLVRAEPS